MKKVILTEDQMKLVLLIKENTEYTDRIMAKIKDLKIRTNKLYNVITFTTLAEMSDKNNNSNINIMKQTHDKLYSDKNTLDNKVSDIQQTHSNNDNEWDRPELEEIWTNLDTRLWSLGVKIDGLGDIIDFLVSASEPNLHKPFNDITPTEI